MKGWYNAQSCQNCDNEEGGPVCVSCCQLSNWQPISQSEEESTNLDGSKEGATPGPLGFPCHECSLYEKNAQLLEQYEKLLERFVEETGGKG